MTNLILASSPWPPLGAPNVPTPQPTNEMVVGTCQADIIEEELNLFVLLSTCTYSTHHSTFGGLFFITDLCIIFHSSEVD
jgi:hypothetical protein